jgi:putative nucleotidyltransferase with HDIG domain
MKDNKEEKQDKPLKIFRTLGKNKKRWNSIISGLRGFLFNKYAFTIFSVLLIALLISPNLKPSIPQFSLNDVAPRNIKAPQDISVEDSKATQQRKQEAIASTLPVFDYDNRASIEEEDKVKELFQLGRSEIEKIISERKSATRRIQSSKLTNAEVERLCTYIKENSPYIPEDNALLFLCNNKYNEDLENDIIKIVRQLGNRDLVSNRLILEPFRRLGIIKRDIRTLNEQEIENLNEIADLMENLELLDELLKNETNYSAQNRSLIKSLISPLITPNLTFNQVETELRRTDSAQKVEPVYYQVKKGEMIVREGDKIDEIALLKLNVLRNISKSSPLTINLLGLILLIILLIITLWKYLEHYRIKRPRVKNFFILLAILLIVSIAISRLSIFIANSIATYLNRPPFNISQSYYYAIPFASGAMLVMLLGDVSLAVVFSLFFSSFIGILINGDFFFTLYALLGSLAAVYGIGQYKERTAIIKSGLLVGLVNISTFLAISLLTNKIQPLSSLFFSIAMCFLGGFFVATVVSALLPTFESLFGVTTDIKLLELSNIDRPLLRELAVKAPGTYHHSIMIGELAEAAAITIGANSLFVRVATLYHDIGKMNKPEYFIENQLGFENKHAKLSPRMSSLILINHVKEGIEIAKSYGLPQSIIDIIPQHHGTRLIRFFYDKAQKTEDQEIQTTKEEDFRYPGPKPQTREAAVIMLADAVEAATRSIEDPTPARIKGMIKKIFDDIFLDGQLDECELTLKDLGKIAVAFQRVLMGIFHIRVPYPGFEVKTKEKAKRKTTYGDSDKKPVSRLQSEKR